jgi:hypothetical protein
MAGSIKFLDKINLQKYLYLIACFLDNKIDSSVFEKQFLEIRRNDKYWMTSSFDKSIVRVMDSIFLDIDEYNPEELYDPNDVFNIDEKELRKKLTEKLSILIKLID